MTHNNEASCSYPPPPLTASRTYIGRKAQEILVTQDLTELSKLIKNLSHAKETEYSPSSSKLLYSSFTFYFPDCIAIKLLKIYRSETVIAKTRSYSLKLLDSLLMDLESSRVGLKTKNLAGIKTLINSCLLEQENSDHDFKLLSSIISRVSVDVFIANLSWENLCAYIISIIEVDQKRTLTMFIDLPIVLDEAFLIPLLKNDLHFKIIKGLLNQDCDCEEWCLFLEAGFNMMLQLVNIQRKGLVNDLIYAIVKSICEIVKVKRREMVVRRVFLKLAKKVRREATRFREEEHEVVTRLVSMIKSIDGIGEETKMAANMILEVLERYYMGGKAVDWDFVQSQMVIN